MRRIPPRERWLWKFRDNPYERRRWGNELKKFEKFIGKDAEALLKNSRRRQTQVFPPEELEDDLVRYLDFCLKHRHLAKGSASVYIQMIRRFFVVNHVEVGEVPFLRLSTTPAWAGIEKRW